MPAGLPLTFTIDTARCRLRAPAREDIPHIFDATRYPGFNDGMLWDAPATMDELEPPLQRNLVAWNAGEFFTFTVELRTDATFLGRISIRLGGRPGVWNLGFWLHPRHQRQGFMREAAAAVLRFGFESLQADEIEAACAVWNHASERVLTAIGMVFAEHVLHGFQKHGQWVAENRMSIVRSAWAARTAAC